MPVQFRRAAGSLWSPVVIADKQNLSRRQVIVSAFRKRLFVKLPVSLRLLAGQTRTLRTLVGSFHLCFRRYAEVVARLQLQKANTQTSEGTVAYPLQPGQNEGGNTTHEKVARRAVFLRHSLRSMRQACSEVRSSACVAEQRIQRYGEGMILNSACGLAVCAKMTKNRHDGSTKGVSFQFPSDVTQQPRYDRWPKRSESSRLRLCRRRTRRMPQAEIPKRTGRR